MNYRLGVDVGGTFTDLLLVNEKSGLNLSKKELAKIGNKIGSDVAFFIYDIDTANVYGRGDIVEKFDENLLDIEVFTPPIECSTPAVYKAYKERFFNPKNTDFDKQNSLVLLQNNTPTELNDLFQPALSLYPDLYKYMDKGFFTGSGSSFFKVKN